MAERKKPQGRKGPIRISDVGLEWAIIDFPGEKAARELMIAEMFVRAANRLIMYPSAEQPSYVPFSELIQNAENDVDFTINTGRGVKRLEVTEFAPLYQHGPRFEDAPRQLDQGTKSDLLLELLRKKSARQGGANRLLLVYVTEQGFWIDPITIEIVRRALSHESPQFERVYFVSPHSITAGMVWEIFPGTPHPFFATLNDHDLRRRQARFPHPEDFSEE